MDLCIDCLNDLRWDTRVGPPLALPAGSMSALLYEYPLDRLITALKFHQRPGYARVLGDLLAIRLQESLPARDVPLPDLVVPVPLHRQRLAERGYNQAELIARSVCAELGLALNRTCLRRQVATLPQSQLDRRRRKRNLRGAFSVTGDLSDQCVAVIDDVVTTGTTAAECVTVLAAAGAKQVMVWAVARTPAGGRHGNLSHFGSSQLSGG